jgi:hypothetical protein
MVARQGVREPRDCAAAGSVAQAWTAVVSRADCL